MIASIGMLYIVEVKMITRADEVIKQKLLVNGNGKEDIERKLKWFLDMSKYKQFSVQNVEKVREKIHVISTMIKHQDCIKPDAVIDRDGRSENVYQAMDIGVHNDNIKKYAVGITTKMIGLDDQHILRKLGSALIAIGTDGESKSAPKLSNDSKIIIEEVSKRSGVAQARDVSNEVNKASFVRG